MSIWIVTRKTQAGDSRFQVKYRRGGRAWPIEHAGSFKLLREAKIRRDLIGGWIAQGLNPKVELAKLLEPPPAAMTLEAAIDGFIRSRHDVTASTKEVYEYAKARTVEFFGAGRDPQTITVPECREFMGWLHERLSAGSIGTYYPVFAMALDYAEVEPNPARHRTVKKPSKVRAEKIVMTQKQFKAMLEWLPEKYRLFFRVLEATGMRSGELHSLTWGDVDVAERRLRVSIARAKTSSSQRWVQLPPALWDELLELAPFEDRRQDGIVFSGLTPDGNVKAAVTRAGIAMARACKQAGLPSFSPHDLRHRRISLWHAQGVPWREISGRVGHAKTSMTADTYTHVVVDAKEDEWL
jgi:integrase